MPSIYVPHSFERTKRNGWRVWPQIFCRVKNHEETLGWKFCSNLLLTVWEICSPNKAGRKRYSAIFFDPEFLFCQLEAGKNSRAHSARRSYFSWWLALCPTRPAFMTTCRILAFTTAPLKRFTAAKTLLYESAEFARPLFHIQLCRI